MRSTPTSAGVLDTVRCPERADSGRAPARAGRLSLAGGILGTVIVAAGMMFVIIPQEWGRCEDGGIKPEVLQALRWYLSEDPREEDRGEHAIRRMGAEATAQLRTWMARVQDEVDRVGALVLEIEGSKPSTPRGERITASEFFRKKMLECRALVRKGEARKALAMADAILLLDPKDPSSWELRRIARRAKEQLLSKESLEPSVDTDKIVYEVGETPEIVFRVLNHDSKVARIRLDKGVLGDMTVVVTQQLIDGSTRREERRVNIQVAREIDQILVGPGQVWENPVPFDTSAGFARSGMVSRVQIAGRFRPTRWTVERAEENIPLPMNSAEFWIVPPAEAPGCDRPLDKLATALFFKKLEGLFVSGQIAVWAGEEDAYFNESLVEILVGSLDEMDPECLKLAVRFLTQATGLAEQAMTDAGSWKAWWKQTREAPPPAGEATKPEEPPSREAPVLTDPASAAPGR